jgi:hypothetical protein
MAENIKNIILRIQADVKQALLDIDSLKKKTEEVQGAADGTAEKMDNVGVSVMGAAKTFGIIGIATAAFTTAMVQLKNEIGDNERVMNSLHVTAGRLKDMLALMTNHARGYTQIAKEENKLRKQNRIDMVEEAKLLKDIALFRLESADHTKTMAERHNALSKALIKENELQRIRTRHIEEQLKIVRAKLRLDPESQKNLDREAELTAKLILVEAQRAEQIRRSKSQLTAIENAYRDMLMSNWAKEIEETNKTIDAYKKKTEAIKKLKDELGDTIKKMREFDEALKIVTKAPERTGTPERLQNVTVSAEGQFQEKIEKRKLKIRKKYSNEAEQNDLQLINARAKADIDASLETSRLATYDTRQEVGQKMQMYGDYFGWLSNIAKAGSEKNKELAVIAAILETFQASINAYSAGFKIDPSGTLSAINAAVALAFGFAQVAQMKSYEEGGFTGHGDGRKDDKGRPVAGLVHENEFVFDAQKTSRLRPFFEDIHNDRIDVRELAQLTRRGQIQAIINKEFNSEKLENLVEKIVRKMGERGDAGEIVIDHGTYIEKRKGNTKYIIRKN